ncbi:unnamed protein product [Lota lota]
MNKQWPRDEAQLEPSNWDQSCSQAAREEGGLHSRQASRESCYLSQLGTPGTPPVVPHGRVIETRRCQSASRTKWSPTHVVKSLVWDQPSSGTRGKRDGSAMEDIG